MNELAYTQHIKKAEKADTLYRTIRELYGWESPWRETYFRAIKDKLLSKEDKLLVKEFHPVK